MQSTKTNFKPILVLMCFLSACSHPTELHGYRINLQKINEITAGATSKTEVLTILGSPSIKESVGSENWIYMSTKTRKSVFFGNDILNRTVIRISFNNNGIVSSIDTIPYRNDRNIELVSRTTPTAGQKITILQQLIGNFGRFNDKADQSF